MDKTYPGKARNIGVFVSTTEWVAFLDSKTIPKIDWLEQYTYLIQAYDLDVVFGVTEFKAKTQYQKCLRATTYGMIGHHTVPGTLIKKKTFNESKGFLEHVRMGEDIEWRDRIVTKGWKIHKPDKPVISYIGLPVNIISTVNKYLISGYYTARLNILQNIKDGYFAIALILSAMILPKWNHLIVGWDANPLFIPHVTKIYLIALVILFLIYHLGAYLFLRNRSQSVFYRTLRLLILIFLTIAVVNWNAVIAGWVEDAVFYVPHITKIYISGVIFGSILYRGVLMPLKRKVPIKYLFPFRWLQIGVLGFFLDLIKAPSYVFGSILALIKNLNRTIKDNV